MAKNKGKKPEATQDIPLIIEVNPNPRAKRVSIPVLGTISEGGIIFWSDSTKGLNKSNNKPKGGS